MTRTKVAIIGSGNIGTDLMIKVLRLSEHLEVGAMVGIDPNSDGLRRAQRLRVPTTAHGVRGLVGMPEFDNIAVVFARRRAPRISRMHGYSRRTVRNSSTSHRRRSVPSSYRRSTCTNTSTAPTSTW